MAQVDPSIKFADVELSYDSTYVPIFAANVTAPVDVIATDYYSTCDQSKIDQDLFASVPGFAQSVSSIYSLLDSLSASCLGACLGNREQCRCRL